MALVTIPFFGPSLAGRSNSTTGTLTLTRWAAICAPITPAPRTATLRTLKRLMFFLLWWCLLDADPGLRAAEQRRADIASNFQLLAALDRLQAQLVGLAVGRVEDRAPVPQAVGVGALLRAAHDRQPDQ